eukprot:scaffold10654_cov190-Skeletonema_dohrnii-CCMP3373.AAC.1
MSAASTASSTPSRCVGASVRSGTGPYKPFDETFDVANNRRLDDILLASVGWNACTKQRVLLLPTNALHKRLHALLIMSRWIDRRFAMLLEYGW